MDKFIIIDMLKNRAKECDNEEDEKQFLIIADLIIDEKLKKAYECWQKMDTYLRETTPDDVYSYLLLNRTGTNDRKIVKLKMKLNDEVVYTNNVEYPSDISDNDIAISLVRIENDVIKKLISFDYSEPVIVSKPKGIK
jgi:hypothetical protein